MPSVNPLPIDTAYRTVDDVIRGLAALEREFRNRNDRRGVFATAYVVMTNELKPRIDNDQFLDSAWVARYTVSFANLYRKALLAYENGDREAVPKAWRIALDTAVNGNGLVFQDLVLGINAHVNFDLALALANVGVEPSPDSRREDHNAVNAALHAGVDRVQDRIADTYAAGIGVLDALLGRFDENVTAFSFEKARDASWMSGIVLINASTQSERDGVRNSIDGAAAVLGRLILAPGRLFPWVVDAMRHLEQLRPWWEFVG